ncbi:uncharacterized protein [Miscanthus floridulus]|uniref:uncharacterized protein n=1 Tax=Miscanthus floridulus TaxID=154761 RepID=UPI00345A471A
MVSGREPVPTSIFTSDQYKLSVHYEEPKRNGDRSLSPGLGANQPSAPPDLKVMELDANPVAELDPLADWRTPYLDYVLCEVLPMDKTEAQQLTCHAKSFVIIEGELYKRSHIEIIQCCIPIEKGKQLLKDIHYGVCGHHAAPRTLVTNAFRQGFYWLIIVASAKQIVCAYEGCQYYTR